MEDLNMDDLITRNTTDLYTEKQKKTVTRNLMDWYNVPYESLNNYIECGRLHTGGAGPDRKYKLLFGPAPPHVRMVDNQFKCICGQKIVELCFVCPRNNLSISESIMVGNECIDKFSISRGKCCEICGARHFNRSFNLCNDHIKIKMRVSKRYIRLAVRLVKKVFKLYKKHVISSHVHRATRLRNNWAQLIQDYKLKRQGIIKQAITSRINERKYMCDMKKMLFETFVKHLRSRQRMYCELRNMAEYVLREPNKYTRKIHHTLQSIIDYKQIHEHREYTQLMQSIFSRFKVYCLLIKKQFVLKKSRQPLDNDIVRNMIYVRNVSTNVLGFGKHAHLSYQTLITNYVGYVAWVEEVSCPTRDMHDLQQYIRTFNRLKNNGYVYVG